ncbi:hypothetical protein B296_00050680 [Ensete ventricosum]|uniref:Uncharacterized protein n=1 Tax=Ensete ventricosum TaxID=4639 RepID=A0A426XCN9_ENSVE|nr:hypothetical protein B296_00050680 [Ensete ventricosum]
MVVGTPCSFPRRAPSYNDRVLSCCIASGRLCRWGVFLHVVFQGYPDPFIVNPLEIRGCRAVNPILGLVDHYGYDSSYRCRPSLSIVHPDSRSCVNWILCFVGMNLKGVKPAFAGQAPHPEPSQPLIDPAVEASTTREVDPDRTPEGAL